MTAKYDNFWRVTDPSGRVRYDTLLLDDAVSYINYVYNKTSKKDEDGIICSLRQISRSSQ